MTRPGFDLPEWAYVPGQNQRHADGAFDALRDTAQSGMSARELARSDAWRAGLWFLGQGYFWESHELIEPVWMVLPQGSPERALAQAVIQIANASLKLRMNRPRATLRLCDIAADLLDAGASACDAMGVDRAGLDATLDTLRQTAESAGSVGP